MFWRKSSTGSSKVSSPHCALALVPELIEGAPPEHEPNVGVILLVNDTSEVSGGQYKSRYHVSSHHVWLGQLWCAFTTDAMAVAYASLGTPEPQVCLVARRDAWSHH
jgi:hypothetical protein